MKKLSWRDYLFIMGMILALTAVFVTVGLRLTAAQIKATCAPTASSAQVLERIDQFNSDLSPYQEITLSSDDLTTLLRQSLPSSSCTTIGSNYLLITVPGHWLATQILLMPLPHEPFWRITTVAVNGFSLPTSVTEQYNQQIAKAWRDFSYDLSASRTITKIAAESDRLIIGGERVAP